MLGVKTEKGQNLCSQRPDNALGSSEFQTTVLSTPRVCWGPLLFPLSLQWRDLRRKLTPGRQHAGVNVQAPRQELCSLGAQGCPRAEVIHTLTYLQPACSTREQEALHHL